MFPAPVRTCWQDRRPHKRPGVLAKRSAIELLEEWLAFDTALISVTPSDPQNILKTPTKNRTAHTPSKLRETAVISEHAISLAALKASDIGDSTVFPGRR
jgi:hypothetical protein